MTDTAADKLRRVLRIIPELADERAHPLEEVAGLVGVDRNRLLRDLKSLADRFDDPGGFVEGVQIYVSPDSVQLRSDHFLRPMRLTVAELSALDLGLALLRAERSPEEQPALDRARARLTKVLATLPNDTPAVGAREASTGAGADAEWLPELRRAMKGKKKARIRYRSANANEGTERVVCPYACVFASGAWYLVAQCERSDGLRVFRLDRIETLVVTDGTYAVPDGFSLENVVRDGRMFLGTPNEEVKIWYGPAVARWVAEREGKPLEEDGSVTLTYPLADAKWVVRHVLQYGAKARVLSPESARVAVREALEKITQGAR